MKQYYFKQLIVICYLYFSFVFSGFSQTGAHWKIIETPPGYYSEDVGVAAYTDADHSLIDKTGKTNSREGIQELLNRLKTVGGGSLYLSTGKYRIEGGTLVIPKGVVLRGDWKQPQKDSPLEGTILMAYNGRGTEDELNACITMEPCTGLYNIAVWYPEQSADYITPYPPTILYGRQGVWGNEYCNVRNVTLVNSYSGVVVSRNNGGGCPNIFNLYGTPLSRGIEIDNIADVGRLDWIDFSPDYWATSGLPGAPSKGGAHRSYILENATGIVMRRNDWSYTCHLSVEGYHTGFYAGMSKVTGDFSTPNGHNFRMNFTNCAEAIHLDAVSNAGILFANIIISKCDRGIVVGKGAGSIAQFYDCEISALRDAILIDEEAPLKLMTQQCKINAGQVNILGGIYVSVDGDFNNESPQVFATAGARMILSGNRFAKPVEINDHSLFESSIDHQAVSFKPLPDFPDLKPRDTKPVRNVLYVITDSEFGAVADNVTDNTTAMQKALNKAGSEGGGIVFLPPGKYRVNGNLTVPSGVEIKGASDMASVPMGQGSIIEILAGKNNPTGVPFLQLSEKSGIRGITFDYPEQRSSYAKNPDALPQYPYCMQVTGPDVYIVNVAVRATYNGIDLFTYQCDNHYVDYFAGHVFNNAIRVGNRSNNGIISNLQFNPIVMAYGYENPKFGAWPNSDNDQASIDAVYNQNKRGLEFMILENCINQILYNNFHYASFKGITFGKNKTTPSGISMGLGIDASLRSICFEGLDNNKGFDLINTQAVSIADDGYSETKYIETTPDFAGEAFLFNSDYWGNARYAGVFGNGKVNLLMPHFEQFGSERFLQITGDPDIHISTAGVNATNFASTGKTNRVSVESSIVALSSPSGYRSWQNNLTLTPILRFDAVLQRNGWIASSNIVNSGPSNAIDGIAESRWTTGRAQYPGQWFAVDTRQPVKFNIVLLDTSGSPEDWPAAYAVYVSDNGSDWGSPIATGAQPSSVVVIKLPEQTKRFIRIEQTGSGKTGYWSIHEFYLAEKEDFNSVSINSLNIDPAIHVYIDHKILYLLGSENLSADSQIKLFNIAGNQVLSGRLLKNGISLDKFPPGMYVVELQDRNKIISQKIILH